MHLSRHITVFVSLLAIIILSSVVLLVKPIPQTSNFPANNGTETTSKTNESVIEAPKAEVTTKTSKNTDEKLPKEIAQTEPTAQQTNPATSKQSSSRFIQVALRRGRDITKLCSPEDPVNRIVLETYGAIYVAAPAVSVSPNCIPTRAELDAFYLSVKFETANLGGVKVTLQKPALDAFRQVRAEAAALGLTVTPIGARASLRDYDDTVEIWQRNLGNGISTARGISDSQLSRLRSADARESIAAVLEIEGRGTLLGSGGGTSIFHIAAPPGTSQHISGLSIDITEHESAQVRALMTKHGFIQTIESDFTHFTYLGQSGTASLGLVAVTVDGRVFFVPKI